MINIAYLKEEEVNEQITKELTYAKIPSQNFKDWSFRRVARYWMVESVGNGLPIDIAITMHEKKYPFEMFDECDIKDYGHTIRVQGHSGCPHPNEWARDGYVKTYHIDTQEGLNEFARVINSIS